MTAAARYEVRPASQGERLLGIRPWKVTRDGGTISVHDRKDEAVAHAVAHARTGLAGGTPATLKIKSRSGRNQAARSYGTPTPAQG